MKKLLSFFSAWILVFVIFVYFAHAQSAPAAETKDKAKDKSSEGKKTKDEKPAVPTPFWVKDLPKVTGKREKRYDINRDEILQTSETKIFLRDVVAEIVDKGSANVFDSALLKAYDKNKDGIINKFEVEEIKQDLSY